MTADHQAIQCNVCEATKIFPAGARAYLVISNPGNAHDRVVILGRSHGGRWIEKWESMKNLRNFRAKVLPPEHPLYDRERIWRDGHAQDLAEQLQRAADREGGMQT